jgi:23S rRNA U2552 (ribose-2'-O)-methylase RlmE/FtsJ
MKSILLRVFVEVNTEAKALDLATQLIYHVDNIMSPLNQNVVKYWKIPEYYEIYIKFRPHTVCIDYFTKAQNLLAKDWNQLSQHESVWSPNDDNQFVLEEVRWAHLEIE